MSLRDEQLRASMLDVARQLGETSTNGWVSGSKFAIVARDAKSVGVDDESHAARLLDELKALDLLVEKGEQPTGGIGDIELRHRQFKRTDLAWKLWAGLVEPIRGVADRRAR